MRENIHKYILCVMRVRTSSLVLIINFGLFITHLLVITVNEVVG